MATKQQYHAALLRPEIGQQAKRDVEPLKKAVTQAGDFGNRIRAALNQL